MNLLQISLSEKGLFSENAFFRYIKPQNKSYPLKKMLSYKNQVLYNFNKFHLFFASIIKITLVTQIGYNFTCLLKKLQSWGGGRKQPTEF